MAWLSGWSNRIEITVDNSNVSSDITELPLPVKLGTSVGQNGDDVSAIFDELGSNSLKIAVTEGDGTTQLNVEVEKWDSTAEEATLWVSNSTYTITASSTTTLYIYYDSGQSDNTTYVGTPGNATNVWRTETVGSWTLAQDPANTAIDSTGNGNGGGVSGPTQSDTLLGNGLSFDGTDDYVNVGANSVLNPDYTTVIARVKRSSTGATDRVYGDEAQGEGGGRTFFIDSSDYLNVGAAFGGSWSRHVSSYTLTDTNNYHVIAYTYDGTDVTFHMDGSTLDSFNQSGTLPLDTDDMYIGHSNGQSTGYWGGVLDQVIMYNARLPDSFINFIYYAMMDNALTFGAEETTDTTVTNGIIVGANF